MPGVRQAQGMAAITKRESANFLRILLKVTFKYSTFLCFADLFVQMLRNILDVPFKKPF